MKKLGSNLYIPSNDSNQVLAVSSRKKNNGLMKKLMLCLCILSGTFGFSQDIHFSQIAETPILLNPASTGAFEGWERIIVNHRNQWLGANTQFMTTSLAVDLNLLKQATKNKAHLGLGLQFFNDIGGDAKFGTRNLLINASGIVPLNANHQISGGLQIGFGHRSGDIGKLYWGNQFNGEEFNTNIASGEINKLNSFFYPEVGVGVYYTFKNKQGGFARDNMMAINAGFSVLHVNIPRMKYLGGNEERLAMKFVLHGDFLKDFSGSKWSIFANFAQFFQGPHWETIIGAKARYRFSQGSKITTFKQDAYFAIGASVRVKESFIPMMEVFIKGFKIGLSYDVITSKIRKAYGGGSFEVSLSYTNLSHAIFKRRSKRF